MNETAIRTRALPPDFFGGIPRIVLAPMEGVVDWVMREMITELGSVDLCVTEFIRVTDRLLPDHTFYKDCPELRQPDCATLSGTPVLIQLLGGQPGPMAENAARAVALGAPGIDLNFGCPAKTVNRHDGGAALLRDPQRIFDVVSAVRAAVPAPLTVSAKVRLGFSDKVLHLEIAKAAEQARASWLTVHARTRDEGYRPPAHWEYIARIREALQIPVIANGDIWTVDDYHRCQTTTGCKHIMMGRGLIAKPGLAREAKGGAYDPSPHEIATLLLKFAKKSADFRHSHYAVCRLKQWLKNLSRSRPDLQELFGHLKTLDDLGEMQTRIEFYALGRSEKLITHASAEHPSGGSGESLTLL